jgi:hypothetical protein
MKKHIVEQEKQKGRAVVKDNPSKSTPSPKGVSSGIDLLDKAFQKALKTKVNKKK